LFCSENYSKSKEYSQFWKDIANGVPQSGAFERINKNGETIWLEATYFPVKHSLQVFGYKLEQIKGQHHRMLCNDDFYIENPRFWDDLNKGTYKSGQFLRKDKYGNDIWLEATYNPVIDRFGKVTKIIKFATNITTQVSKNLAVAKASEVALSTSVETSQIAKEGASLLNDSVALSTQIADDVRVTVEKVQMLNVQSQNIFSIVSIINGIAEQTNLLALNAAIASRTSKSTSEITHVITANQKLTEDLTSAMESVVDTSSKGKDKITEVSAVMDEIYRGAENVSKTVMQLSES